MINKQHLPDRLISMTDYVLDTSNTNIPITEFYGFIRYAKFLKQPLELWMFIPCDEEGNILFDIDYCVKNHIDYCRDTYEKAESRILFERCELESEHKTLVFLKLNNAELMYSKSLDVFFNKKDNFKTIEDLVSYDLKIKK